MTGKILNVYEKNGTKNITISVTDMSGEWVNGRIIDNKMSVETKAIFKEFQSLAENQIFSLLDQSAERIEALGLNLGEGKPKIYDVQIFEDKISFKIESVTPPKA